FWILFMLVTFWSDRAAVVRNFGLRMKTDISGMADWQRLAGFSIDFGLWILVALACWSGWRLFSNYLAGRIFTAESALLMRRLAVYGLSAQGLALLARPVIFIVLSLHLPPGQRMLGFFTQPPDLLNVLFLFSILAFSQIFLVAADVADDHAGIV
ncbi:MAG: DUF2975 domain-containing protein, partial [Beijerinckiaceae bacterium]